MYCLNMLAIALELSREDPAYEDVASKFFEHFVYIARAMNDLGGDGIELWDKQDGFYYDVLHLPAAAASRCAIRSMVGLIPLFAVETLEPDVVDRLPGFKRRMQWFIDNRPDFASHVETISTDDGPTPLPLARQPRPPALASARTSSTPRSSSRTSASARSRVSTGSTRT